MGIQFYNGLSNFNPYSGYRREIPSVSADELKINETNNKTNEIPEIKEDYSQYNTPDVDKRSRVASLEDISLTFNKEESFDYLNNDSSVKSLDMQKAISDMQKDGVLQEYQYFVGSSRNLYSGEDGMVIAK